MSNPTGTPETRGSQTARAGPKRRVILPATVAARTPPKPPADIIAPIVPADRASSRARKITITAAKKAVKKFRVAVADAIARRIGYRALADDELAFVLTRHWKQLSLALDLTDFTDAAIGRDHPRRLPPRPPPVDPDRARPAVNNLTVITDDVVETARGNLVIGDT
jgi:hypothetical protein